MPFLSFWVGPLLSFYSSHIFTSPQNIISTPHPIQFRTSQDISKHNSVAMAVLRSPELSDALPRLATLRALAFDGTSMDGGLGV
jgi:hypothetical protein